MQWESSSTNPMKQNRIYKKNYLFLRLCQSLKQFMHKFTCPLRLEQPEHFILEALGSSPGCFCSKQFLQVLLVSVVIGQCSPAGVSGSQ